MMKSDSAEDGKGKKKKNHKSARRTRNRGNKQTSIADIIDWEINLRRNTTVLYDDLLPAQNNNGTADIKTVQTTSEVCREGTDLRDTLLQRTSNGLSAQTLSSFFESATLLSIGEDESMYSYEWIRLQTFSNWPLTSVFSTILARNGWVSLGDGDRARCYSCHVVHKGWRIGDDPDQYHSPNCRFKSGQSNNAPISRAATSNQTSTLEHISQNHQQFPFPGNPLYPGNISVVASSGAHPGPVLGVSEQALSRPQQDSIQPWESNPQPQEMRETNTAARTGNLNVAPIHQVATCTTSAETSSRSKEAQGINIDRPKYPSYAILAVRISSFTDWPTAMTQTPQDMALAGFFYSGYGDYTRCFFCGGGLRNWEARDDPWFEHARWFKGCAFVRKNRGQEFMHMVQKCAAQKDEHRNQEEKRNIQTNTNAGDPNSAQTKDEKVMRLPAVTTIKEMGYSEDKIKAAIRTIKSRLPRAAGNSTQSSNPSDSVVENTSNQMSQSNPAKEGDRNDADKEQYAWNAELEALRQENTNLRNCLTCKICMEKKVAIGLSPCGHLVCCGSCASNVTECPVCQENVTDFFKAIVARQKNRLF